MAKSYENLRKKMSPESLQRARAKADIILNEMALDELNESLQVQLDKLAQELLSNAKV